MALMRINKVLLHFFYCITEKQVFIDLSRIGGEGGIRTLEGLQTLAGFQDQCIQPLCHLSGFIKNVLGFTYSE